MLQKPPIIPDNETGIPRISISMIDLTGANRSYSGAISTSLKTLTKATICSRTA